MQRNAALEAATVRLACRIECVVHCQLSTLGRISTLSDLMNCDKDSEYGSPVYPTSVEHSMQCTEVAED
jgi:hypothetical protein